MFDWFKKKSGKAEPESKWVVTFDGEHIGVSDAAAQTKRAAKHDLSGVAIETNDSGPWGADLWWLFFRSDGQMLFAFPQGATGEKAVIDYLLTLPSFDHGKMIEAMASTENAIFVVWQRSSIV
ncbi:hypothetical protein G4G27_04890 [Sphingomonas sp. So64.6b]|uniref:hypothetical protein n=1 Tax=Sphingomonas sp. So64.6b TaxID=2997354 RepID=UPI0015FFB4B4|nr:hypothetical protein [Sphingomonas sp. So64.6b]QNA83411.1 hypothetical protein G4G27_04890 [Sphingomonas sp. So64.6b]